MQVTDNRLSSMRTYFERSMQRSIYASHEWRSLFRMLCEELIGLSPTQISLAEDTKLTESQILRMLEAIKALKKGRPIQYIIGHSIFYGLNIQTGPGALIPRPETEELVQWIIDENASPTRLLDIGTGTGCIALALRSQLADTEVLAMDISAEALTIARANREYTGLDIELIQDDILSPKRSYDRFDIIVSNPPYVLESDKQTMRENVLEHEPGQALFVPDEDPLLFYRSILEFTADHLEPQGSVYFEIHESQGDAMRELCISKGFHQVDIRQDLQGKDRMLRARQEAA